MFLIDKANLTDERLYVDVQGKGTIEIIVSGDGLIVNIYPFHVVDEPVATCWADNSQLCEKEV